MRAGRYEDAEKVFAQTVDEFMPVRDRLDEAVARAGEDGQFFDDLTSHSMEVLDISN